MSMNLTPYQIDILTEMINIGVGRAAGMLNAMLQTHINLQIPFVKIFRRTELEKELGQFAVRPLSMVELGFKGSFSGTALLVFPPDSASYLVNTLTGEEPEDSDFDAIRVGALTEVGNIVLNGVMGSISNVLSEHLHYTIPIYVEDTIDNLLDSEERGADPEMLLARTCFVIEQHQIEGDIILIFRLGMVETLLHVLDALYQEQR